MNQDDLARAAEHAPNLKALVVVSLPDGAVVGNWSGSVLDGAGLATRMATFLRAGQILARVAGHPEPPRSAWLDTSNGALVVAPLGVDQAVGLAFEDEVPLGLARVQVQEVIRTLDPAAVSSAASLATVRPEPISASAPTPEASAPKLSASAPAPEPNAPPLSVTREERPEPTPSSGSRRPLPRSASAEDHRPRAVRLLEFLRRYAPDPHVTMLRLSLRTGISLEQLDRPEELDGSQIDQLAESVRDIIGQEQLGI